MTDQEIRALRPGDTIHHYFGDPGRFQVFTIRKIAYSGDCVNEHLGPMPILTATIVRQADNHVMARYERSTP